MTHSRGLKRAKRQDHAPKHSYYTVHDWSIPHDDIIGTEFGFSSASTRSAVTPGASVANVQLTAAATAPASVRSDSETVVSARPQNESFIGSSQCRCVAQAISYA